MNRALVILALLVGALWAWDRGLAGAAGEERAARSRVGRLVSEEERAAMPIAAVRLEVEDVGLVYGRVGGAWRCLDFHHAFADGAAIESLVNKLTRAQGFVVSDEPGEATTYGIATPRTVRVMVCGPKVMEDPNHDALVTFDVGASASGRDGAFVRLRGSKEVWAIDTDPRAELTPHAPGLPPLLDPGVVPRAWPGWERGVARLFVDRADGSGYELQRRAVDVPPEELQRGRMPWVWTLDPGEDEVAAAMVQSHAYSLFLARATYVDLADPDARATLVGTPASVVTIVAPELEPLVLELGTPLPNGRVPIWNDWSKALVLVEPDVAELLAPPRTRFAEESDENPWDAYLHR